MGQGGSKGNTRLQITITSGDTLSQQLFDFQLPVASRIVDKYDLDSPSYLVYTEEGLTYANNISDQDQPIYSLTQESRELVISKVGQYHSTLWRVLKQSQMQPLEIGDEIKIGKCKFTLKSINQEEKEITENQENGVLNHSNLLDSSRVSLGPMSESGANAEQCRICFEKSNSIDNPLICLCKCSGSVKFIHFECLKDWIGSTVTRREGSSGCLFYSYLQIRCEICKQPYEPTFIRKNRRYSLLSIDDAPLTPYATFENVQIIEDGRKKYEILMVGLKEEEILIGRNSVSHVVMKEISVSRTHCAFIYRNRQLYISDKNSKFGTLIRLIDRTQFNSRQGITLQFQSKLIKIHQKESMNCCCVQDDSFVLRFKDDSVNNA